MKTLIFYVLQIFVLVPTDLLSNYLRKFDKTI